MNAALKMFPLLPMNNEESNQNFECKITVLKI